MEKTKIISKRILIFLLALATVFAFTPALAFTQSVHADTAIDIADVSIEDGFPQQHNAGEGNVAVGGTVFAASKASKFGASGKWKWTAHALLFCDR